MDHEDESTSTAWLLVGMTGNAPGVLQVVDGTVAYAVLGPGALGRRHLRALEHQTGMPGLADALDAGARVTLFEAPVDAVTDVTSPWHTFGAGLNLTVAKQRFRFSFLRPNTDPEDVSGLVELGPARQAVRTWRATFTNARAGR
jgi:hypothetical protein